MLKQLFITAAMFTALTANGAEWQTLGQYGGVQVSISPVQELGNAGRVQILKNFDRPRQIGQHQVSSVIQTVTFNCSNAAWVTEQITGYEYSDADGRHLFNKNGFAVGGRNEIDIDTLAALCGGGMSYLKPIPRKASTQKQTSPARVPAEQLVISTENGKAVLQVKPDTPTKFVGLATFPDFLAYLNTADVYRADRSARAWVKLEFATPQSASPGLEVMAGKTYRVEERLYSFDCMSRLSMVLQRVFHIGSNSADGKPMVTVQSPGGMHEPVTPTTVAAFALKDTCAIRPAE